MPSALLHLFLVCVREGEADEDHDTRKLKYGDRGEVVGPAKTSIKGLLIKFPGIEDTWNIGFHRLSHDAPPTVFKEVALGDWAVYTGKPQRLRNRDELKYADRGKVVGPFVCPRWNTLEGVEVKFPGNTCKLACSFDMLSRDAPPTKFGGFEVGDEVRGRESGYERLSRLTRRSARAGLLHG